MKQLLSKVIVAVLLFCAGSVFGADNVTVSDVKFTAKELYSKDSLTISCKVRGLKEKDWMTYMLFPKGSTPGGGQKDTVRDTSYPTYFKGADGDACEFKAAIKLDGVAPGTYTVFVYGWAPEYSVEIGEIVVK